MFISRIARWKRTYSFGRSYMLTVNANWPCGMLVAWPLPKIFSILGTTVIHERVYVHPGWLKIKWSNRLYDCPRGVNIQANFEVWRQDCFISLHESPHVQLRLARKFLSSDLKLRMFTPLRQSRTYNLLPFIFNHSAWTYTSSWSTVVASIGNILSRGHKR